MKPMNVWNSSAVASLGVLALLMATVAAAPMEPEEESAENALQGHGEGEGDAVIPLDAIDLAALRKLLLQLDTDDRYGMARVTRSWGGDARGWGARALESRLARQWRADKRQVRFRQCYFNPISCFRK